MAGVDEYLQKVINLGDEGSALLAKLCAPTLKNSEFVEVLEDGMNGVAILRIPKNYVAVVHSSGGDSKEKSVKAHAASLVKRLVKQAKDIGAIPVAFADVIDSRTGDTSMLETIANSLVDESAGHRLAIMNGENAILGPRVNCDANISGTMVSIMTRRRAENLCSGLGVSTGVFQHGGCNYAIFDPQGKAIFMNSDGVGTKTEFYERTGKYDLAIFDSLAMKLDDTVKRGATAMVVSDIVETKGRIPFSKIAGKAFQTGRGMDILYIMQHEHSGSRLMGYNPEAPSYNISGSVVSVIDEEKLRNPPKPSEGEGLIAISGKRNPRSNGITDKRKTMIKLFGPDYHKTPEGKLFLEYLARPSIVLYPVFKRLIDEGLATSFYHMSGGAWNGKLARPLAKHGLFAKICINPDFKEFAPDWRELALAGASFTSARDAYSKWPMGVDGFVTSKRPIDAIGIISKFGLEVMVVDYLEKAVKEKTGVMLTAYSGKRIYFSGRN